MTGSLSKNSLHVLSTPKHTHGGEEDTSDYTLAIAARLLFHFFQKYKQSFIQIAVFTGEGASEVDTQWRSGSRDTIVSVTSVLVEFECGRLRTVRQVPRCSRTARSCLCDGVLKRALFRPIAQHKLQQRENFASRTCKYERSGCALQKMPKNPAAHGSDSAVEK